MPKSELWMWEGTADLLMTIHSKDLEGGDVAISSKDGYELVCSYSWAKGMLPKVYVPGNPPGYIARPVPFYVPHDSGLQFVDLKGSKSPKYPFEVVCRALEVMNPKFKFDGVDILINRNTLRKLLGFCLGSSPGSVRFDLYSICNTLIVQRYESYARDITRGTWAYTRGHNFEEAVCQMPDGMADVVAHHRVLQYKIGDLTCAVRCEVDATYDPSAMWHIDPTSTTGGLRSDFDILDSGFHPSDFELPADQPIPPKTPSIQVVPCGTAVPHSTTAELKTSHKNPRGQLWFGRTPWLIRGCHERGLFHTLQTQKVDGEFEKWEQDPNFQQGLRKMSKLLTELRDVVKNSHGQMCIAIYNSKDGCLQILAPDEERQALPRDMIDKFWTTGATK